MCDNSKYFYYGAVAKYAIIFQPMEAPKQLLEKAVSYEGRSQLRRSLFSMETMNKKTTFFYSGIFL
jgi:hypothetical protein